MIKISILGSTGSIGRQALEVIRENRDKLQVVGLSTNKNIELLKQQINEFMPTAVAITDTAVASSLSLHRKKCSEPIPVTHLIPLHPPLVKGEYKGDYKTKNPLLDKIKIYSGKKSLSIISTLPSADVVLVAVNGFAGLIPTLKAIDAKKVIALATKEVIVSAGELIMKELSKQHGIKNPPLPPFTKGGIQRGLIPVDSEHSAIYQCLLGEDLTRIKNIILTCSGGPFRNYPIKDLNRVTISDVLKHPVWKMGKKITVDSATLMNKAFEVIEAHHFFNIEYDKIKVVIHPQCIIHSMVEFIDGSIKAQLSYPDMRIPIQYALFNGERNEFKVQKSKVKGQINPPSSPFNKGGIQGIQGGLSSITNHKQIPNHNDKKNTRYSLLATHYSNNHQLPITDYQSPITDYRLPITFSFEKPNVKKFPALMLGYEAGKIAGTMPTVLNSANEVAVNNFLSGKIKFIQIPIIVEEMMGKHKVIKNPDLNTILEIDRETKIKTQEYINSNRKA